MVPVIDEVAVAIAVEFKWQHDSSDILTNMKGPHELVVVGEW